MFAMYILLKGLNLLLCAIDVVILGSSAPLSKNSDKVLRN